ncbi:MAG: DUF29 domain-containing protein [Bryobacteraceae bacterium]|nr:DUF29 domain-containing protein [Bryobacteraceae bacterium]
MVTKASPAENALLYEADFVRWSRRTAELILARRWEEIDPEILADEVGSLASSDERRLRQLIGVILKNLLKWYYQPEYRCGKWSSFILEQRFEMEQILEASPSLLSKLPKYAESEFEMAREWALIETGVFQIPETLPYSAEQIVNPEFLPE